MCRLGAGDLQYRLCNDILVALGRGDGDGTKEWNGLMGFGRTVMFGD